LDEATAIAPLPWRVGVARNVVPFTLAGLSLVGVVLDAFDVPHDDAQSIAVLGSGAAAGAVASLVAARWTTTRDRAERARRITWTVVRLFLAYEMVRYGMPKILGMQFYPQYWKLDLRAVDMDAKALAWTFFGRSFGYQAIGGVLEVAAGALLCFRRTTLLGACLLAPVITDVVLVNFFYDVPVKLFSSVYLLLTIALVARDAPRLWAAFFPPRSDPPRKKSMLALGIVGAVLVVGLPIADTLRDALRYRVFRLDPLEGAWRVDQRAGLDDLLPEAPGAWDKIYFEKGDFGFVRVGHDRVKFATDVDETQHTLRLAFGGHAAPTLEGAFEQHDGRVHFAGERGGKAFSLDLTREIPR
jgi:uncharacterized membrane protein YphA (DoxX/SURF4 family)